MTDVGVSVGSRLSKKQLVGYAMGDLGGCMTFAVMGSFLTSYYTDVVKLDPAALAVMFMVIRVWDAINDPLMGAIMDKLFARTKAGRGKFIPWMKRATPLLFVTSILMFTAPTMVEGAARLVAAFVTYLLYEASYTIFNVPYGSLLSAMSHNDAERSSLSSARGFGSMIGNLIPLVIFPVIIEYTAGNPAVGYGVGIAICAVIGFAACLFASSWSTEDVQKEKGANEDANDIKLTDIVDVIKKNRAFDALCLQGLFFCTAQYFGQTLGIYMFRDVLGALPMMSVMTIVSMGTNFVILALMPKISNRFGLERSVRVSQVCSAVLYVILFAVLMFTNNVVLYLVLMGLAQGVGSITVLMQWGMVGEAIDYNEYVTGKRTEGSIYGFFNLTRRFGQAVGQSGSVAMLGVVGYVAGAAAQPASAALGIKALVVLVPAACMLGCWISLKTLWNITPEIREKMASR